MKGDHDGLSHGMRSACLPDDAISLYNRLQADGGTLVPSTKPKALRRPLYVTPACMLRGNASPSLQRKENVVHLLPRHF
jgi:hypothetical protein